MVQPYLKTKEMVEKWSFRGKVKKITLTENCGAYILKNTKCIIAKIAKYLQVEYELEGEVAGDNVRYATTTSVECFSKNKYK